MDFHFGTRKIVEAAGVLLRSERATRMSYLRLLKLLYIADRESLKETGRPIVGTSCVAMDHGPVHSEVFDLIRGRRWGEAEWSEFVEKDGYEVGLKKDPGVQSLSRYEIRMLEGVSSRYRDTSDWEIVEYVHTFEEWKKNYREGTSTPIPLEDLIEAVGRAEDRDAILRDAERTSGLNRVFGGGA